MSARASLTDIVFRDACFCVGGLGCSAISRQMVVMVTERQRKCSISFFPSSFVVVVIDLQTDDDDDYYDGEQVERKWIVTSTSIGAHCHCYCKEKRTI